MNNEDALKEADYREAESTCPLCGGKPTRFLERPNECGACWLPVGQWQVIRRILGERDEAREAARYMLWHPETEIYHQLCDRWPWLKGAER